jgi:carboxyl-terminal processing protease
MHLSSRTPLRWAALGFAGLAALGGAFTLGAVTASHSTPRSSQANLLDDAASEIATDGLHPVQREALDAAAIKAMLTAADDQWGSWGHGASDGAYGGVGLWLQREGIVLEASRVLQGGPAQLAGIHVGDHIGEINGVPTIGLTPGEAAAALRGRPGTTVQVALIRGNALRTVTLTRVVVPASGVTSDLVTANVGRIVVPVFVRGTGREVRDAAADLRERGASGLVLDLRGNPGGLLSEAVETASAFLNGGDVVTYTRRDERPQHLDAVGHGDATTPLVVLVDGSTASAAEVVAGALQDRGRAVVVGTRTFGKGTVQEPHRLPDGSSLALTVARYTLPSGRSVEGVGIEPDIEVTDPSADLSRAVEVLSGLLADTSGGRG